MAVSHATAARATGEPAAPATPAPEPDTLGNAARVADAGLGGDERLQAGGQQAAAPLSFASHDAAVAHHKAVKQCFGGVLDAAIAAGIDPDKGVFDEGNLLHNSAEWIKNGNATVHILTPTHDAAERGTADKLAFFDATKNWNELDGDYDPTPKARGDARLSMRHAEDHGAMNEGGTDLTMINPTDKGEIRHTLIHEVQHDADQTWSGEAWEQKKKGWDQEKTANVNGYQSEFRAYWIMEAGQFPPANKPPKNTLFGQWGQVLDPAPTPAFKNARQEAIFWYMAQYDSYQKYLFSWAEDAEFRQMVHNFSMPVSGNIVNSVRIQTLSEKLADCSKASAVDSAEVVAALDAGKALDGLDREFLADASESAPFWGQARRMLSADALAALQTAVA